MADDFVRIQVEGLDRLQAAISRFPREIAKYLGQAGNEAASRVIFPTEGLKKYPPATEANQPPTPYYIRGKGTQVGGTRVKEYNLGNSEQYLDQWYAKREGYTTAIGNRSSYAKYLAGEEQARAMARIGWRKLLDVVTEKMDDIVKVYQAWTDKLLRDLGL